MLTPNEFIEAGNAAREAGHLAFDVDEAATVDLHAGRERERKRQDTERRKNAHPVHVKGKHFRVDVYAWEDDRWSLVTSLDRLHPLKPQHLSAIRKRHSLASGTPLRTVLHSNADGVKVRTMQADHVTHLSREWNTYSATEHVAKRRCVLLAPAFVAPVHLRDERHTVLQRGATVDVYGMPFRSAEGFMDVKIGFRDALGRNRFGRISAHTAIRWVDVAHVGKWGYGQPETTLGTCGSYDRLRHHLWRELHEGPQHQPHATKLPSVIGAGIAILRGALDELDRSGLRSKLDQHGTISRTLGTAVMRHELAEWIELEERTLHRLAKKRA